MSGVSRAFEVESFKIKSTRTNCRVMPAATREGPGSPQPIPCSPVAQAFLSDDRTKQFSKEFDVLYSRGHSPWTEACSASQVVEHASLGIGGERLEKGQRGNRA